MSHFSNGNENNFRIKIIIKPLGSRKKYKLEERTKKKTWPRNFIVKTLPLRTRSQGNAISIRSLTTKLFQALTSLNSNSPLGYSWLEPNTLSPLTLLSAAGLSSSFANFCSPSASVFTSDDESSNARVERFRRGCEREAEVGGVRLSRR